MRRPSSRTRMEHPTAKFPEDTVGTLRVAQVDVSGPCRSYWDDLHFEPHTIDVRTCAIAGRRKKEPGDESRGTWTIRDRRLDGAWEWGCLLYTSPSPRDGLL